MKEHALISGSFILRENGSGPFILSPVPRGRYIRLADRRQGDLTLITTTKSGREGSRAREATAQGEAKDGRLQGKGEC